MKTPETAGLKRSTNQNSWPGFKGAYLRKLVYCKIKLLNYSSLKYNKIFRIFIRQNDKQRKMKIKITIYFLLNAMVFFNHALITDIFKRYNNPFTLY
ncbi:MAG: hypothetical protein A2W93_15385 [Bacteroidetes bacterium GWF2_43_63]|nr:MAG: hypothetical protein A2W94_05155 [Bacteroidetes bacterium GWE2_42_42]OFY53404.1 MAG: hypothetical protein A2W93_15385 [Bacteroidetes bacterium GWF2_43_63]HBG69425.1 hypothetical protein [Bacteroidales bacterium]HCB62044.1 hypothetical protein [Bacteroidales bacterium]HCY23120.1 hypothetical protein [Bacteroidales bacterium]